MGLIFQLWRGGVVEKGKERSFVVVDYSVRARRCGPLFKRDTWGVGIGHNHSVSIWGNCGLFNWCWWWWPLFLFCF